MKIYRPDGKLWREVVALDSSFCEETLERFNRISLDFVLAEEVLVPEFCYVTWRGERYSLFSTPKVVKVSTREYRYTLNLDGRHLELDRVLVKDKLGRTKFVFTGRTDQYAELISDCLPSWKVGACTTGDVTRVIAFNNTSLLEACRMVASKFETEVQLTDGAISFGRVERYKSDPLLLAYREGLKKDITVEPDPKETAIGRLYVVGGDRNIDPAKYGGHQLHLPKGGKVSVGSHSFVADAEGRYISLEGDTRLNTSERAFDATSIYPKRVGTVSKVEQVGDEWDVLDDANTIDYAQHRVGGDTMRLEFQSGRLAGRTFDLATKEDKLVGYVDGEKRFKLVRKEIDGVLMPEPTTFYPAVGDKYAIFGCSLPDEYITSAEGEMLLRGAEYMAERLEPRLQYRAELDGLWAKKSWGTVAHKLVVGTIVRLEGASSEVRISSVRTSLNSPYTPRITFSNAPYMVGSLATQIATLENAEVRQREELRAGLVKLQDRTYKDTEAVREMVEKLKVEGFSQSLKPETLQTMYAVIGSPALQFEFVGRGFSWNEGKGGAVTIPKQVIRQRVAGTTLEPNPKTVETTIPALTYTLKPDEQQAHIYVELKPTPRYVVSTKPLQITPNRLLVGLLNGTEGSRDFTPLYGFTEISPSHIATRYIRSRSGNMFIDLETGDIYSDKITFKRPDGSTKSVEEVITDTVQVGGRNLALRSQQQRRLSSGYAYYILSECLTKDTDYTIQFDVEVLTPPEDNRFMVYFAYSTHLFTLVYIPFESGKTHYSATIKTPNKDGEITDDLKSIYIYPHGWGNGASTVADVAFSNVKLERGTVATDWSPAPEDVQASIENEAKAREAGDKAIADTTQTLEQALDALRESGANDNATLTDLINKANQRLDNLQEQADGEVSNWFYPGAPAPDKAPENEWTTNGLKARHIGDTYTSTDESGEFMGKSWRYTTEFKWQEIHDTLVSQALAQASKAQTTADGKNTTFLVKPTKYEEGDTWVMESSQVLNGISYEAGTMLFAKQGSSAFVESHWVDKVRYIGASQLKESEKASKRAWEAYANAQAEAERVKAEAHADGIVTAEEQARINATNKALQSAKAYAEAQDKLLEERQKAYADGVLTEAEKRAIEVAEKEAKLAETNANAYADGVLTEAEKKAIAQAQKAYDDAVAKAKELDGQIQVGGRNLLLKSDEGISNSDYRVGRYYIADPSMMVAGEAYTIQIWGEAEGIDFSEALWVYNSGGSTDVANIQKRVNGVWKQTFKWRDDSDKSNSYLNIFRGANHPNHKKESKTSITRIKLEKGSIATDWTPAPEDVQAEIQAVERGYQKLIERVDVEFAISNSRDTAPTSGWQTNAPTPARGQALWQRTKVYLKDGTAEVRGVTCIQGKDGLDGADGKGITRIVELYYLSSSNTALANGAWSETVPTPKEGFWIWTKTRIHYTTGEQIETQPICVTGNKGADAVVSKEVTIDATGLDENMYYPIAITDTPTSVQNRYRVYTKLYYSSNPSWATRGKGFQCELIWRCYNSIWGAYDVNMQVEVASYRFTNYAPPMSQPSQITQNSTNYTYVRGGGKYYVELQAREQATLDKMTAELVTSKKDFGYGYFLEPQTSITAPITDLDKEAQARATAVQEINAGLTNANTLISTLDKAQKQLEQGVLTKADTKDIQYLLDSLKNGKTQVAGGLVLTNNIILSDPNSKDVTAMISGSQTEGAKAMRLGITYTCDADKMATVSNANDKWGVNLYSELQALSDDSERMAKLNELGFAIVQGRETHWRIWVVCKREDLRPGGEATAFNNNGTGHIGELFFNGNYIGFGTEQQRYMTIGGVARTEQEMNEASTEIKVYPIASAEVTTDRRSAVLERWQSAESNRELRFEIPLEAYARCEAIPNNGNDNGGGVTSYSPNNAFVTVWAELEMRRNGVLTKTYKTAEVRANASVKGGSVGRDEPAPMPADNRKSITGSIVVPASSVQRLDEWTLILKCKGSTIDSYSYARGSTVGGKSYIPYDNSQPLISITDSKAAFFYGRQKQVLLNYASEVLKVIGNVLMQGNLNVKGTITADSYQGNGMPLAGATFNSSGGEVRALGRYKNRSGWSSASAYYDYSTKSFTVYHSIPHDKYIPLVTPFGTIGNNTNWNLAVRVYEVRAYSFTMKLLTNQDNPTQNGFSYVAFQAE